MSGSARSGLWAQALAIFAKDVRAELRNRTAISSVLLFALTSLVVVAFALGPTAVLNPVLQAALLWVIIFFAAFSGLSHTFIQEEETGTAMALRLTAAPGAILAGKLLFNLALLLAILLVVVPLFILMLHVNVDRPLGFVVVLVSGGIGLGVAATIIAAIIAKARGKGALYGAIGFPILIPLLFMAVDATTAALDGGVAVERLTRSAAGMTSFWVMILTVAALLFPVVWED